LPLHRLLSRHDRDRRADNGRNVSTKIDSNRTVLNNGIVPIRIKKINMSVHRATNREMSLVKVNHSLCSSIDG
jgi:hypothetical protein